MINKQIIKWFNLLIKQLQVYADDAKNERNVYLFKINAITRALDTIRDVKFRIKKGSDMSGYPGIGKGVVRRIDEIIKSGKLSEVNQNVISDKNIHENLMDVFGIGLSKARELAVQGIYTVDQLKTAVQNKTVSVPEYVIKGIEYVDKINLNIPRKYMVRIDEYLNQLINHIDPRMKIYICGSYRRSASHSNDIDIIITHPLIKTKKQVAGSHLLKQFVELLIKKKFIIDSLTSTDVDTKYMGICKFSKLWIRIDIRYVAMESVYTALLYFTGSGKFNRRMRGVAKSLGYKLNEYFLLDENNKPFRIKSEKDIFNRLNMEYVSPDMRK